MNPWQTPAFKEFVQIALAEDINSGDATTDALIDRHSVCEGEIVAKSPCIIAGQWIAKSVFEAVDPDIDYTILIDDGLEVSGRHIIATVAGNTASVLAGERLALNFLQRLCGIATATRSIVDHLRDYSCRIVDTRKTAPGHRLLDKYAVRMGGGFNHRMHLGDGILIKDNHIKAVGSVAEAVRCARGRACHTLKIQVEVSSLEQAQEAVAAGADSLLLDNLTPDQVRSIIQSVSRPVLMECSGNITRDNIKSYAATGVHIISIGALTHSVMAADISLNLL